MPTHSLSSAPTVGAASASTLLTPRDRAAWAPSAPVLWALVAALTLLWFITLDARLLTHPDEGRYAEIAREMAVGGDWVTPRLNDLKYLQKPPLQYWLTAVAFETFGVHEWTARLWPAVAGFLAVLAIGFAGRALGGVALGAYAALALAATVWHAGMAQIVTLDSALSFFLALGLSALLIAQRAEAGAGEQRLWMWVASAAFAGATLTKGLIGVVLPGGALVVYTALTRDFALWRRLHLGSGLVLYLALTAPWFVAVSRENGEFLRFFFLHEHFGRFLHGGEQQRPGPWYYFVPCFLLGALPWLAIVVVGARRAWRDGQPNALGFSWQRFALSWAIFVFVFFSASGSKLPSYILPMFPPLALVIGWLLLHLETRSLVRLSWPLVAAGSALALGVVVGWDRYVPYFADERVPVEMLIAFGKWVKAAAVVAVAGGIALLVALRFAPTSSKARFAGVAMQTLGALAALQIVVAGFDTLSPIRSASGILRAAQQAEPFAIDAPFYQVGMYDQTVPFYLGRATRVVELRHELALGIDAEPQKQVPTLAAWLAEWQALARGYALMAPDVYALLVAHGVPLRVLARASRSVLVSRQ